MILRNFGFSILFAAMIAGDWVYCDVALAQAVKGDSSTASQLEEVVVTATRREEREQDVPISLTAFSQQALDVKGIRQMDDLADLTPGITFIRNGAAAAFDYNDEGTDINIRGIDSSAGTSTTGIYIDDTPIQSRHIGFGTQNAYPAVFDLERVEVLRGPQGTLFGASSEGGTVRFIQPSPNLTNSTGYFRSELATTQNGDPTYDWGAAFGVPIIDDVLGFRVSASFRRDGGWVDRVDYLSGQVLDPRANYTQTTTVRAALTWKPADTVTVTPSFYYQELYLNDTSSYWPTLSNPGNEDFKQGNFQPNKSRDPFYIASVRVDWNLEWAQLFSNTSFYSRNQYTTTDYTVPDYEVYLADSYPPDGALGTAYLTDVQNNFYQELRLQSIDDAARVSWTAGLFLTKMNENSIETITDKTVNAATGYALCATIPCPGGVIYNEPYNKVIDKQAALFGEVVVRITDTFKATGGLRISKDRFEGSSFVSGPYLGQPLISTNSPTTSETPVTPKGVLSWQPNRDNLVYVSAEKGFRVGGINSGVGTFCEGNLKVLGIPIGPDGHREAPGTYSSDSLWSYEIGGKNTLLDQRLQINSSLYLIDWKNIQQNVFLGACGLQYTGNLGRVRSRGGDIALLIRPVDELTINLTAAYTDAKYTGTVCATSTVVCTGHNATATPVVSDGDALAGAPWQFIASAEYVFLPVFQRKPYIHMDWAHTTAQTALVPLQDRRNALNDPTIPGLPQTNNLSARAGLRWGGIDVSVFGQNLTDEHPLLFSSRDFVAPYVLSYRDRSVRPRTIGITATYRY
jgi:iron complex outermembrane receptor protein